jgi:hypothetical protein
MQAAQPLPRVTQGRAETISMKPINGGRTMTAPRLRAGDLFDILLAVLQAQYAPARRERPGNLGPSLALFFAKWGQHCLMRALAARHWRVTLSGLIFNPWRALGAISSQLCLREGAHTSG